MNRRGRITRGTVIISDCRRKELRANDSGHFKPRSMAAVCQPCERPSSDR